MANFTWPFRISSNRDKRVPAVAYANPKYETVGGTVTSNSGDITVSQTKTLTQNSTTAVDATFYLPANAQILDILVNNDTAWDSAVSATLSVGTASAGTQYLTSLDLKTAAGRIPLTATHVAGTQSTNWASISTNTTVVATATPSGATGAGSTRVTISYTVRS